MIITADTVTAASIALVETLVEHGVRGAMHLIQVPKRDGHYRKLVGTRLGRLEITPVRTENRLAMPDAGT